VRKAIGGSRPEKEEEAQRALSAIVSAAGLEFARESPESLLSLKRFRPDFSHEPLSIALETKLVKSKADSRRIVEEIAADVTSYQSRFKWI